jgi:hypothetical protein
MNVLEDDRHIETKEDIFMNKKNTVPKYWESEPLSFADTEKNLFALYRHEGKDVLQVKRYAPGKSAFLSCVGIDLEALAASKETLAFLKGVISSCEHAGRSEPVHTTAAVHEPRPASAGARIVDYLKAEGPKRRQDIAAALGLKPETAKTSLRRLVLSGTVHHEGGSYSLNRVESKPQVAFSPGLIQENEGVHIPY